MGGHSTQLPSFCSSLITSLTPVGFKSGHGQGWDENVTEKFDDKIRKTDQTKMHQNALICVVAI